MYCHLIDELAVIGLAEWKCLYKNELWVLEARAVVLPDRVRVRCVFTTCFQWYWPAPPHQPQSHCRNHRFRFRYPYRDWHK
jgi:hypothetical protein